MVSFILFLLSLGEHNMDVQSQNSGNSPFYDRIPYFIGILTRPLLFVKRGCMFFYINALPQNTGEKAKNRAGRRVTHNAGNSYVMRQSANMEDPL